jgi:phospholipase C
MPNGPFDLNLHWYDQPTVYQRLEEKGISWKIYHHGMPQSTLLTRQWEYLDHYAEMDQFLADARQGPDAFPQYCFIEPDYSGTDENDQHPPSDVMNGEALIAQVYNTLRANETLWQNTLLVLLYDEHGGFYDHMAPPATVAPDEHHEEYGFNQLGLRVPALLISPWVERGVCSTVFDHTSLLRYVSDKWQLGPLGQRVAEANSFANELLQRQAPRTDTPPLVKPPALPPAPVNAAALEHNAEPLLSFAHILGQQAGGQASQLANQPDNPIELRLDDARQYFRDFLNGQSAPPKKN